MSMQDPISDTLTRIRNAQQAKLTTVDVLFSNINKAIINILFEEGFISKYDVKQDERGHNYIEVTLKYFNGKGVAELLKRVSKPSLRKYSGCSDIPSVMNGLGVVIISTSKGVMTGKKAKELGVGGEILCYVA